MTNVYHIENQFKFIYEERKLTGKDAERVIFTPAARCLKALLDRQGEVLSKDELISIGWEEAGPATSLNALYQTISHLRTSLEAVGGKEEIIKTIKRVGFVIEPAVSVVLIIEEEEEEKSASSALNTNNDSAPSDEQHASVQHLTKVETDSIHRLPGGRRVAEPMLLALSLLAFLLSSIFAWKTFIADEQGVYNNFQLYKKISENCSVYVSWNSEPGKKTGSIYDLSNLDCKQFNRVYLTVWHDRPGTSGIYCHASEEGRGTFCKTKYFGSHYYKTYPDLPELDMNAR